MNESYATLDVVVTSPPCEDFSNTCVILCRPGDVRLARNDDGRGHWEQVDDGPAFVVITAQTSMEKCERFAHRFNVELLQLLAFRDGAEATKLVH